MNFLGIIRLLKDPIWQFFGVVVTLVGIYLALPVSIEKLELVVYHENQFKFNDYKFPQGKIDLLLSKGKKKINEANVDYFIAINKSKKPIQKTDFHIPITIKRGKSVTIHSVSSCTPTSNNENNSGVAGEWAVLNDIWSMTPELLNSEDYSCVMVVSSQDAGAENNPFSKFQFSGKLIDGSIKYFKSRSDYQRSYASNYSHQIHVEISGYSAYWFVIFQIIFLYFTIKISARSGWIISYSALDVSKLLFVTVICTCMAEIFMDIFINLNWFNLHPIVPVLTVLYVSFLIYLHRWQNVPND